METCKYLSVRAYHWGGDDHKNTSWTRLFTPELYTRFKVNWANPSFRHFFAVIGLLYLMLQFEINSFYLKTLLWIPTEHPGNAVRLYVSSFLINRIFFFLVALPAARESYQYLTDSACKRFGMHAWMAIANILTELMVIVKFSRGEAFMEAPVPIKVKMGWGVGVAGFAIYFWWMFLSERRRRIWRRRSSRVKMQSVEKRK
jgi:phosphatidylserine synthase 2